MAAKRSIAPVLGTSIESYRRKRDFSATSEPAPQADTAAAETRIFVVQKHDATRLHYDFRLEHEGVLWSWAVPKGPSLDTQDKRLAVHVEDHPREYAAFEGTIPVGNYGAGTVEIWDRGSWMPLGDAAEGLARGELKFTLAGERLRGQFVLVRLKPRPKERAENWLLIKEHDGLERAGADAAVLEQTSLKPARRRRKTAGPPSQRQDGPADGARRAHLPATMAPQLATLAAAAPGEAEWVSEVKFDGYRLLAWVRKGEVTLMTRNGQDWTKRLRGVAAAIAKLNLTDALVDGELVALKDDGVSSFSRLQAALSDGRDQELFYYLFDLLHWNGWDLRSCALSDRKRLLQGMNGWHGVLRFSEHIEADGVRMHQSACGMGLEGIVCKRAGSPYRPGRGGDWVKVKCTGREEFVVLGWTDPQGSRSSLGALHLGFHDEGGALHYAGGVGTGFSAKELGRLRGMLDSLAADVPPGLLYAGDPPDRGLHWVCPKLVAEVRYVGWSGAGRVRHASFLGLREDKTAAEVVREVPDRQAPRMNYRSGKAGRPVAGTVTPGAPAKPAATITTRTATPQRDSFEGVRLTHPDKQLWPGISKHDLAEYWRLVAQHALPGIAHRPLAFVRCPNGTDGEHFFQKHVATGTAPQVRGGESGGAPWLAIDGMEGLIGATQMAAIELHTWGASLDDALHPDRLVFDLDPGEGVTMGTIVAAAHEVRERLNKVGLSSWCRTSGGKGLHVVAPLSPCADWDSARAWCRRFAETMEREAPERYVANVSKKQRIGRILVDWLRNGLGSTAVASFCPRARPGAGVATPLAWTEVTARLDPAKHTLRSVPARLAAQSADPWDGFAQARQKLPPMPRTGG